jgi:hypothetical protein
MKRRSTENELLDISLPAYATRHRLRTCLPMVREAWVPKSQVEDNGDWTCTMPSWQAKDKGLCDE